MAKIDEQEPSWIDVLNRLQSLAITIAVFVMIIPCLYQIRESTTKTANEVQSIKERLTETEQAVLENMRDAKKWQKASEYLKQH